MGCFAAWREERPGRTEGEDKLRRHGAGGAAARRGPRAAREKHAHSTGAQQRAGGKEDVIIQTADFKLYIILASCPLCHLLTELCAPHAYFSASLKLAYKDLTLEDARREKQAKNLDPRKAAQFERLGMAYSGASRLVASQRDDLAIFQLRAFHSECCIDSALFSSTIEKSRHGCVRCCHLATACVVVLRRGISHSVMSDMQTIEQETPSGGAGGGGGARTFDDSGFRSNRPIEDEYEILGGPPKYVRRRVTTALQRFAGCVIYCEY